MQHVGHIAKRSSRRDDWHLWNLHEDPKLLARLHRMLESDTEGIREFAKKQLGDYERWLTEKGLPPLGANEREVNENAG